MSHNHNAHLHTRQSLAHHIMQLTFVRIRLIKTKNLGKSHIAAVVLLCLDHKMHLLMNKCIIRLNPKGGKELSHHLDTPMISKVMISTISRFSK